MATAEALGVDDVGVILTDLYGLEGTIRKGQFNMTCPVHEDSRPSCDVSMDTGYWNCWSCPASGDLVDLGVVCLLEIPFEVKKQKKGRGKWLNARKKILGQLRPSEPDAITAAVHRRVRAARKAATPEKVRKRQSDVLIPPVSAYPFKFPKYLRDRGFSRETLKRWKIRYAEEATLMKEDGNTFTVTHAVAIPVFDRNNVLLGWCYRATEKSESWFQNVRYIYTPGLQDILNTIWFGMHLHKDSEEVAIVEGALDAIWCDQHGIPALAILGSQVKQVIKVRQLMDFRKITLYTDRDASGATTAHYLGSALIERGTPCTVVLWPRWVLNRSGKQAKDAQDLCGLDLELLHARAIPFVLWRRSNRAA